ncbi:MULTISPECIES: hypothetical protein [Burkholderia]|uniref:Lipoprotein n=1 Tax=Burkholderia sola TaxID=2843302 RepID=A0ABV2C2P7_9BURK|nr:hypothetical protein [Burkholderia sp. CpTa8-5]MBP0605468.1 hypothetical protein [Burkholderia sp. CpTa8-5]
MKSRYPLIASALTSALAGCAIAVAPQYVEPTGGDAALLTFAKNDYFLVLPSIFGNASNCTDRNRLPAIPNNGDVTRTVVAGQPLSISLLRARDYFSEACTRILTFTPESGHHYTAMIKGYRNECRIELSDAGALSEESTSTQPVQYVDRKVLRPFLENGAFCTE